MRGGGRVQSPGRPGCRGMKPPPSPAEAFKYGRGPRTRGAAGGAVCGACGLGGRRCPRERDLHRRCAPALEVGKRRSPRGAPFSWPGCARGPGLLRVCGGAPCCTILVPLFGPGGNHVVSLQEVSRAGLLIRNSRVFEPVLFLSIFRFETKEIFPPLQTAKRPTKERVLSVGPKGRFTVPSFVKD